MQNSKFSKIIIGLAVLVVLIGVGLQFVNESPRTPPGPPAELKEIAERRQLSTSTQHTAGEVSSIEETQKQGDEFVAQMLALKLPREKIEAYLEKHNRDAASLLAAFHASGDTNNLIGDFNYLKEAATNFPNDPHVQWTVLAQNIFPEDRRKWLDAFKASSPGNSLANYLSAQDYFKNGQTEAAVNELLAATGKSQFGNYAMETFLAETELYRASGKLPMEVNMAAMSAMAGDFLPELATFKGLALNIQELQKQYLKAGDTSSAENLGEMSLALANRLNSGDGGKLLINQLVGIAIEAISLSSLDQNASYDFLGGKTPKERSEELKQQRKSIRELTRNNEAWFSKMTEAETLSYFDRQRLYGELEAARWLHQRYNTNAP